MVEQAGHASLIGRRLGNYAVEALLGRGATGAVYLAKDTALGRPVALKVLLGSLARSQDHVTRFLQEAKAVAPLQHPHIVGIYEAGVREGTPFIAMEYIEGEALDRFLRRNAPLNWRHSLYIAAQVTEALQCAHHMGVVHRDVKPGNILLDRSGYVRLTDFGIARMQQDTIQQGQGYSFCGTPDYMSPEQCGTSVPIGPRSDFFSLGAMLYQMLSGTMPFSGQTTPALIQRIVNDTPTRLNRVRDDVPDDVARLVANLMEKSPGDRPAEASLVLTEINRIQRQDGDSSALPEALNAFIREMAEPAAVKVNTPLPGERRPLQTPRVRLRPEQKRLAPVSALSKALLIVLMLVGLLGAGYWHFVEAPRQGRPAVALDSRLVSADAAGRVWVNLPDQHWVVDSIQWVGDEEVALVSVQGRPGTPFHGSRGLLSVNPEIGTISSVSAPVGPVADAGFGGGSIVAPHLTAMPAKTSQAPLASAFVISFPPGLPNKSGKTGLFQALAQRWDASEPSGPPLFSLEAAAIGHHQSRQRLWQSNPPAVPVAIHPNGHTICLLLYDADRNADYLVERDVRWRDRGRLGRRLITTTTPIEGNTFQYNKSGKRLAYFRLEGDKERSLWVVDTDTAEPKGVPVATGLLGGYAFSPDGSRIAVTRRRHNEADRAIFVDAAGGKIEGDGGPGRCDTASWHPSGKHLIVQAHDDETEEEQLWSVSTSSPYVRTRLTDLAGGAQCAPAVSRSGQWIATVSETERGPAILLLPWRNDDETEVQRNAS